MSDPFTQLEAQGRWPEVLALCQRLLPQRPQDAGLWLRQARALGRLEDRAGAVAACREAWRLRPEAPEVAYALGQALLDAGELAEAVEVLRDLVRRQPRLAEAHNTLGNALARQKETAAAIAAWEQALAVRPDYVKAHYNLGKAHGELRRWRESETHLRRALGLDERHVAAWNNLGNALRGQYRLEEAEACYRRALDLAPDHRDGLRNLAMHLKDTARATEALPLADRAVARAPADAGSHAGRGAVLAALRDWPAAEAAFRRAWALDPLEADAQGLAQCLAEQGQLEAALALLEEVQSLQPDKSEFWAARASVLSLAGRWADAQSAMARAEALAPELPDVRYNHSLYLLRAGRYREGWARYEDRKQCPGLGRQPYLKYDPLAPAWDGATLPEARLLVYAEQGLGDSLQFCRFLPEAKARVGRLVVAIQAPLLGLLARWGVADELVTIEDPAPACDRVSSLISLPHVLGVELDDLPGQTPYVSVDPARLTHWRARLGPAGRFRVGLVWGGNPLHGNDHRRSLALEQLRPLFALPDIEWFSLQVGPRAAEIAAAGLAGILRDLAPALTDFDETAAAVSCLDLLICADTSVIHLTGALGRPGWVMLPEPPDWRWLHARQDTPWYPSLRLFRQPGPGDWAGLVADLEVALRTALAAWRGARPDAPIFASSPRTGAGEPPHSSEPSMTTPRPHADPEPRIYQPSAGEDLAGPSSDLGTWLREQGISLALSTYQSSRLYLIGGNAEGKVSLFKRLFEHAMGLFVADEEIWLASRFQVLRLQNILAAGEERDGYDRLYVPRASHTTGDLDMHDLVRAADGGLYGIATRINALVALDDRAGVRLVWQPPFISALADGDRCHLNGLAMRDGRLTHVTLVGASDEPDGWRQHRADGGQLWDLTANRAVLTGLSMPHSPRWYRDRLWLLNSGRGEFGYVDFEAGRFVPVQVLPGYPRGLAFHGDYAVIGLSLPRDKTFNGLPLDAVLASHGLRPQCGFLVLNLNTGEVEHTLRFEGVVRELYDIQIIPGARRPMALGFQTDEIKALVSIAVDGRIQCLHALEREEEPETLAPPPAAVPPPARSEADPELDALRRQALTAPSAQAFMRLGQAFRQRQAWLGAIDAFRQAGELDPGLALAWHQLGMAYLALDQKAAAEEAFEKALEIDPRLARTRANLARLYLSRDHVKEAARQFELAVADEAGFYPAHLGLIEALARDGRGLAAQRRLDEARRQLRGRPDAAQWLAPLDALEQALGDGKR